MKGTIRSTDWSRGTNSAFQKIHPDQKLFRYSLYFSKQRTPLKAIEIKLIRMQRKPTFIQLKHGDPKGFLSAYTNL